ncbi:CxC2 domain-containing protein [Mycena indigotica]|uniref:CxC2 domain-containing protein n=1 Tax=Mycena indigotica TaxID=2126181 RepID=A0A8H6W150_9AGAR|nr:CxC2 domain-containing protein [Mycena indigotica]KAF7301157.1 CxC2 domain-containing protein [Mycena indigotica]
MLRLLLVFEVFMKLFVFVVPKLHILRHTTACQLLYSFNYTIGGGQTDGEGIERPWSMIGGLTASTQHPFFDGRLDAALHEQSVQQAAFEEFSLNQAERVPQWKAMVDDYEKDGTKPNPYEGKVDGLSEVKVREMLEMAEDARSLAGKLRIHEISPVSFMADLLELEGEQRRVAGLAELKKAKSTTMKINLRRLRRGLNKRISKIRQLQATYMPVALQHLKDLEVSETALPEDVPLLPPSALTASQRGNGGCHDGLVEIEKSMRDAQCRAALAGLRNQLLVKYRLLLYKTNHSRNQSMNTCSRSLAAWLALVLLHDGIEANVGWRRLCKEDIRCLEDPDELAKKNMRGQKAEIRRAREERELREAGITPLNIHQVQTDDNAEDDIDLTLSATLGGKKSANKKMPAPKGTAGQMSRWKKVRLILILLSAAHTVLALHIEWAKAYARVRRWNEEVALLREEWRRLPESFAHEERLWPLRGQAVPLGAITLDDAEGMIAYAVQHVDMYRALAWRAEIVRTEPKLKTGMRRKGHHLSVADIVSQQLTSVGSSSEEELDIDGTIERDDFDADEGNFSDEELLLMGEIDDW